MISPDQPTKLGSHSSKETLDDEGFFIPWPKPKPSGNRECPYILLNIYCCFKVCVIYIKL
jgi:hypothetical protein